MKTRSQSVLKELEVNIDFDSASEAWNANKKRLTSGCYQYVCGSPLKMGGYCSRRPEKNCQTCYVHKKSGV